MKALHDRTNEELAMKQHTLLVEEFKLGIWTLEEYKEKVNEVAGLEDAQPSSCGKRHSPEQDTECTEEPLPSNTPSTAYDSD
jgi:hypothetical protein